MEGCEGDLRLAERGIVEDGFVGEDLGVVSVDGHGGYAGHCALREERLTMATVAMVLRVIHTVNLALVLLNLSLGREPSPACFSTSR